MFTEPQKDHYHAWVSKAPQLCFQNKYINTSILSTCRHAQCFFEPNRSVVLSTVTSVKQITDGALWPPSSAIGADMWSFPSVHYIRYSISLCSVFHCVENISHMWETPNAFPCHFSLWCCLASSLLGYAWIDSVLSHTVRPMVSSLKWCVRGGSSWHEHDLLTSPQRTSRSLVQLQSAGTGSKWCMYCLYVWTMEGPENHFLHSC